jgi:very-short-patch-repair endonuclease
MSLLEKGKQIPSPLEGRMSRVTKPICFFKVICLNSMMYSNNHYNKRLKEFARELRTSSVSKAEKFIWKAVLSRKQTGERFLRQRPIDNFIVDFFAPELVLIIEIDGSSHYNKVKYDFYRQRKLESLGYVFLRYSEGEVIQNIGLVKEKIDYAIFCLKNNIAIAK